MASGVLVVGVAGGTFALLARPRIGTIPVSRAITSAVGAVLVVALGLLSPTEALASLDATTLLLLFGMLCHVEALRRSGWYGWAAVALVEYTTTSRRLTLGALGLSAVLSAVALNDATVLLLTPVLITATRRAEIDPVFPLLAVVLGANIGSLATPLGNPQNALVLAQSGITTVTFVATLAPITLVVLVLAAIGLGSFVPETRLTATVEWPSVDTQWALSSGLFIAATLVLLALVPATNPGIIAASMGITHIAWLQFFRRVPGTEVLQEVDWGILVMFIGIFVVVGGLEHAGAAHVLETVTQTWSLPATVFVLSNVVSNVPAVVLLATTVHSTGEWFMLAAVSTLAGNATPIGSAATLIVLDQAQREGVDIPLWGLLRVGFPVAVITSLAAIGLLTFV